MEILTKDQLQNKINFIQAKLDVQLSWVAEHEATIAKQTELKTLLESNIEGAEKEMNKLINDFVNSIENMTYREQLEVNLPNIKIRKNYSRDAIKLAEERAKSAQEQKDILLFGIKQLKKQIKDLQELYED